jgi:hypothetical protein
MRRFTAGCLLSVVLFLAAQAGIALAAPPPPAGYPQHESGSVSGPSVPATGPRQPSGAVSSVQHATAPLPPAPVHGLSGAGSIAPAVLTPAPLNPAHTIVESGHPPSALAPSASATRHSTHPTIGPIPVPPSAIPSVAQPSTVEWPREPGFSYPVTTLPFGQVAITATSSGLRPGFPMTAGPLVLPSVTVTVSLPAVPANSSIAPPSHTGGASLVPVLVRPVASAPGRTDPQHAAVAAEPASRGTNVSVTTPNPGPQTYLHSSTPGARIVVPSVVAASAPVHLSNASVRPAAARTVRTAPAEHLSLPLRSVATRAVLDFGRHTSLLRIGFVTHVPRGAGSLARQVLARPLGLAGRELRQATSVAPSPLSVDLPLGPSVEPAPAPVLPIPASGSSSSAGAGAHSGTSLSACLAAMLLLYSFFLVAKRQASGLRRLPSLTYLPLVPPG